MSYKQCLSSISKSKTFSSKTSVSYNMGDNSVKSEEKPKDSIAKQLFDKLVNKNESLTDSKIIEALAKMAKDLDTVNANAKKDKSKNSSGFGASASAEYSETSSEDSRMESESTEITCDGVGGNIHLFKEIQEDPSKYKEWLNSLKNNPYCWCDFINETILPIYEFIPIGYKVSAQQVKTTWENYLISKGQKLIPLKTEVKYQNFTSTGAEKVVTLQKERNSKSKEDGEISTSAGKTTGWKVRLEPMNLDGGKVAVGLWLTVGEHGLNSGRSLIQLRDVTEFTSSSILAIDPSTKPFAEFEGSIVGKCHDWIDVTDTAKKYGCTLFDTLGARVYVKVDGSGDDYKNIGVNGRLQVQCLSC